MSGAEFSPDKNPSTVGVIDKVVAILSALESEPANLVELVERTGISRPTVHRLAAALIHHRLVTRDDHSRYVLGHRLSELAAGVGNDLLSAKAGSVLAWLRDITGESSQIFRRQGDTRVCTASAERPVGLRDTIPVGSRMSMKAGSAAQILLAWEDSEEQAAGLAQASFTDSTLAQVRRRGWAQTVGERENGVASVSAPIRNPQGKVIAAVSISGPTERLTRQPGKLHSASVMAAGHRISDLLRAH